MSGVTSAAGTARWAWLALILTLLVPVWWGADISSSWDVDNIAPGSVLKGMVARFGPGWYSSYGPLPYYVTAAAYLPLVAVMKLSGELGHPSPVYPWGFAHPEASALALVVTARLVTLLLALGVAWLASRDVRRSGEGGRAAWVPVLLLGSAVFAYYARTSNVDLHGLFWLWLGFHLIEEPGARPARLALGAAAATLAMCCKEQLAPISAVAMLWAMWRASVPRAGGRSVGPALLVALVAAATYALAWRLPFGLPGWTDHNRFILTEARYARSYPLTPAGVGALGARCAQLLPLVLGPALLVLTVAALALRVSWRGLGARATGLALYLATFVGSIGYVYPRFLLPLLLVAVPLSVRAIGAIEARLQPRPALARSLAALVLALALAGGPALSVSMLFDPRLAAERWLREHLALDERLELTGNPHFQVRASPGMRVIWTRVDSLRVRPRGPVGDVVMTSSITDYQFERDSTARLCYWDPLHAGPPLGRYHETAVFRNRAPTRWMSGLPVAPTIRVFERTE
jgi:hypothetical protein